MFDLVVRHPADEDDMVGKGRRHRLVPQRLFARPATDQQQLRLRPGAHESRHRGDQVVQTLIIIEAADEADHVGAFKAQLRGQRRVAIDRRTELVHIDPIGRNHDLVSVHAARDQVAAQPFADHRHGVGRAHRMGFKLAGQPIARIALHSCAVADRRILPESADFVDHGQAVALGHALRRDRVQHRRMGMNHVRPPFPHQRVDRIGMGRYVAPFANQRIAAGRFARRAVEGQAVDHLLLRPLRRMAVAGDAAHLPPPGHLRAQDRTGAKGIAAMERQTVVQDMENTCHSPICLPKKV